MNASRHNEIRLEKTSTHGDPRLNRDNNPSSNDDGTAETSSMSTIQTNLEDSFEQSMTNLGASLDLDRHFPSQANARETELQALVGPYEAEEEADEVSESEALDYSYDEDEDDTNQESFAIDDFHRGDHRLSMTASNLAAIYDLELSDDEEEEEEGKKEENSPPCESSKPVQQGV